MLSAPNLGGGRFISCVGDVERHIEGGTFNRIGTTGR